MKKFVLALMIAIPLTSCTYYLNCPGLKWTPDDGITLYCEPLVRLDAPMESGETYVDGQNG